MYYWNKVKYIGSFSLILQLFVRAIETLKKNHPVSSWFTLIKVQKYRQVEGRCPQVSIRIRIVFISGKHWQIKDAYLATCETSHCKAVQPNYFPPPTKRGGDYIGKLAFKTNENGLQSYIINTNIIENLRKRNKGKKHSWDALRSFVVVQKNALIPFIMAEDLRWTYRKSAESNQSSA